MRPGHASVAAGLAVGLALIAAYCARPPEAGAAFRVAFVGAAVGGCALLWWAYGWWRPSARSLLLWAFALRLIFAPILPGLSDDGYRYLWDGHLQQEGISPYAYVPSDPALAEWHGTVLFEEMNSPDYHSVYPPVSQFGFRAAAVALPLGWTWAWYLWKGIVVLAEAVGLWALVRWVGPRRSMLYALHPVVLVEVAGQAHTEGLLLGALGVIMLSLSRTASLGPLGVAVAALVKLWPLAWAPLFRRGLRGWVAGAVLVLVSAWSFELHRFGPNVIESLRLYAGTFDFYNLPYRLLKSVMYPVVGEGAGRLAASVLALAFAAIAVTIWAGAPRTRRAVIQAVVVISVAYALTSPTLHPWHLLAVVWMIPLLDVNNEWLWLTSISLMTYLEYTWPGVEMPVMWIGWLGAVGLFAWSRRGGILRSVMQSRARGKSDRLIGDLDLLSRGANVLDLGAGEGYVGREISDRLGVHVHGYDVADLVREGSLPVAIYDGTHLPEADRAYDATVLVYVLHHAETPETLLREAARVTRGRIVVLETVCYGQSSRRWLEAVDRLVNRLRSGGRIDETPLAIRTDADWKRVFAAEGLTLVRHEVMHGLHPKALYVLDGQPVRLSTSSTEAISASIATASG